MLYAAELQVQFGLSHIDGKNRNIVNEVEEKIWQRIPWAKVFRASV